MGVHKGLVALVVGMAVLIVVGLVAVAWGLIRKSGEADFPGLTESPPPSVRSPAAPSFGDVTIPLAEGETVLSALPSGDRVIVHIQSRSGGERLVVLDPRAGKVTGQFKLEAR